MQCGKGRGCLSDELVGGVEGDDLAWEAGGGDCFDEEGGFGEVFVGFVDFFEEGDFVVVDFGGRPQRGFEGTNRDVALCLRVGMMCLEGVTEAITDASQMDTNVLTDTL